MFETLPQHLTNSPTLFALCFIHYSVQERPKAVPPKALLLMANGAGAPGPVVAGKALPVASIQSLSAPEPFISPATSTACPADTAAAGATLIP